MPQDNRARTRAIRERMAATGEPYSVAARQLARAAAQSEQQIAAEMAAEHFQDHEHLAPDELGVAALPDDATPAQRARAEALWRPQEEPAHPCRCSGTGCRHGQPCLDTGDGCPGRFIHTDRYPGSTLSAAIWQDEYVCAACDGAVVYTVEVPGIPWGEISMTEAGITLIAPYQDVRHPNFKETHPGYASAPERPDGDGECHSCGGYAFAGLVCGACRAQGWSDYKGWVEHDPGADFHPDYCGCEACAEETEDESEYAR